MSPFWQWFFAIIGLVAFIMAAPYILQLIFGQPRIGFSFDHDDSGRDGRLMKIHLMNVPINNRLLQTFKVSRLAAQDVFLSIGIFNASTKEAIFRSFVPEITFSSLNKATRISLPPSILMASVSLAKWERSTNSAILLVNRYMPLQEGAYVVKIEVGFEGKLKIFPPILLHVGKIETEMMWDKDIANRFFYARNLS